MQVNNQKEKQVPYCALWPLLLLDHSGPYWCTVGQSWPKWSKLVQSDTLSFNVDAQTVGLELTEYLILVWP